MHISAIEAVQQLANSTYSNLHIVCRFSNSTICSAMDSLDFEGLALLDNLNCCAEISNLTNVAFAHIIASK